MGRHKYSFIIIILFSQLDHRAQQWFWHTTQTIPRACRGHNVRPKSVPKAPFSEKGSKILPLRNSDKKTIKTGGDRGIDESIARRQYNVLKPWNYTPCHLFWWMHNGRSCILWLTHASARMSSSSAALGHKFELWQYRSAIVWISFHSAGLGPLLQWGQNRAVHEGYKKESMVGVSKY